MAGRGRPVCIPRLLGAAGEELGIGRLAHHDLGVGRLAGHHPRDAV